MRRAALASVLGASLLAPPILSSRSFGQQPARFQPRLLPVQHTARPLNDQEMLRQYLENDGAAAGTGVVHPQYLQPTATPQAQQQAEQMQYVEANDKPGLFSRIFRGFRRDNAPAAPPQDPGMRYPRGPAAQPAQTAQQPAQSRSGSNDVLIPPQWNENVVATSPSIQVPAGGNDASGSIVIPPAYNDAGTLMVPDVTMSSNSGGVGLLVPPPVDGGSDVRSQVVAPQVTPQVTSQDLLVPQITPAPASPPKVAGIDLGDAGLVPELTAPAPLDTAISSDTTATVEIEEDMDLLLNPDPAGKPSVQAAAPLTVEPQLPADDPLANAFPDDVQLMPVEEIQQPYSGLALDEEPFTAAASPTANNAVPTDAGTETPVAPQPPADIENWTLAEESAPTLPPTPAGEQPALSSADGEPAPFPMTAASTDRLAPAFPTTTTPEMPQPEQQATQSVEPAPRTQTPQTETPEVQPSPSQTQQTSSTDSRLDRIRSRSGKGLKGFCAVALRDDRDLRDAKEEFSALFNGRLYSFSNEASLQKFLDDPMRYAPAARGNDVIHLALTGEEVEGSLDYAAWYQGRLYLFTSVETMETFTSAPGSHATEE
ncbi:MAG: hypothetical protein KDA58_06565 [Planctomycetaceae bacterium]|nr:hypothetical protein [Planctomycetaceae bacterium]